MAKSNGRKFRLGPYRQKNSLFQNLGCLVYTLLQEQRLHNSSDIILGQSGELRQRPEFWTYFPDNATLVLYPHPSDSQA